MDEIINKLKQLNITNNSTVLDNKLTELTELTNSKSNDIANQTLCIDKLITRLENINLNDSINQLTRPRPISQIENSYTFPYPYLDTDTDPIIDDEINSIILELNNLNINDETKQIINYLQMIFMAMTRKTRCYYNDTPLYIPKYVY